jgi:hypothetical protein
MAKPETVKHKPIEPEAVAPAPIVEIAKAPTATHPPVETTAVASDPRVDQALGIFADLKALEINPATEIGAREILSVVPVRKPKANEFVRVHETLSLTAVIYEDRDEREPHYVLKEFSSLLIASTKTKLLVLAVNQLGDPFIWPVPLDAESSRSNTWNESQRAAYHAAKTDWVKMVSGKDRYHVYIAEGELPPPRWPEKDFRELLAIAFHNRTIDRADHPVIKAMFGRR